MTAPSITDDDVFTALKAFILAVVPEYTSVNIQQGQQNNTPMPPGPDYVIMIPADRIAMNTTVRTYDPSNSARDTQKSIKVGVFVNFYGPNATDYGQIFSQLFKDLYGADFFAPYNVQPLDCDDGRQMPLVDSEKQYATRWMIHAWLQINPTVSTTQDFAGTLAITSKRADHQ